MSGARMEAEQAVLGSILIDSRCLPPVLKIVRAEYFSGINQYLFEVIADLFSKAQKIDPVIVLDASTKRECPVEHETLRSYVLQLMEITPTAANAERYAHIVRERACVAQIHARASEMLSVDELPALRRMLHQTSESVMDKRSSVTTTMDQAMTAFYDKCDDGREWLPWPFAGLRDRLFVRLGDFIVLGAESSVGKTAMALQLATYWASKGKRVGFFSLETDSEDITDRMLAGFLGVDMQIILRNQLTDEHYTALAHISSELTRMPLTIVNANGMTAADIATRSLIDRYDVILVDYLQLVTPEGGATREREVAAISTSLKNFGRSSNVTVVALSQLNRDKLEKQPSLDRLRDSSQLRNDADLVFLMYLKDPDAKKDDPQYGVRVLNAAKNKRGPKGLVHLAFDAPRQLFYQTNEKGPKPLFRLLQLEQMGMGI